MPPRLVEAKPALGGVLYLMVNGKSIALLEVKHAVHPDDIVKTIKGISSYETLFPHHKDFDVYGAIAGFKISKDVAESAKAQGLMMRKRVRDVIEIDAGEPYRF